MNDTLTFFIPGATATTLTPIKFSFDSHGIFTLNQFSNSMQHLYGATISPNGGNVGSASFGGQYQNGGTVTVFDMGWSEFVFTITEPDHYAGYGTFNLTGMNPTIGFSSYLYAVISNGGADFSNTATVNLTVPTGVTFTSASGAFLTQVDSPVIGLVPEPATWAMFLLGFGVVGYSMRRRKVGYKAPQAA
jgi:hypothetical protein